MWAASCTKGYLWLVAPSTCPSDPNGICKYADEGRAGLLFWVRITPVKSKQLCLYQDGDRWLMLALVGLKFYPYAEEGERKRLYCGKAEMTDTSNFVELEEWVFRFHTQL